jgi:hypothetical protein
MTRKVLNFKFLIFFAIIGAFILNSCRHNDKPRRAKTHRSTKVPSKAIPLKTNKDDFYSRGDSISFFELNKTETGKGDTVGFVSLSDINPLPGSLNTPQDSVDRLVLPDLKNKKPEETQYLVLTSKYRKRLLMATGISEADSLFVYDYSNDTLLSFPISSLEAVASLSIYEDATVAKHTALDYQFGFQINKVLLAGLRSSYFGKTFVYIGVSSPFARRQMHPIIWEKIDPKKVPAIELNTENKRVLKEYKFNNAYDFESDGFHYYLQEYLKTDNAYTAKSFRILIINTENEVIYNYLDYETEVSSPAPISVLNDSQNTLEQWTGHLLKNRPPVLVGFDYISFGCDVVPFVDKSNKYISLNCDNRH